MFGLTDESPQNENTTFYPRSPYGISKVAGFHIARNYREAYNMFACNGILFNHESPRRGYEFVTRKISLGVAKIKLGLERTLKLGNLDARRDWGYAPDFVKAMWLMLQQNKPDDYVVGTGESHSVKEFVQKAFEKLNLDYEKYVAIDPRYFRPSEVDVLLGDSTKARNVLGWKPKVTFIQLIDMMVEADLEAAKKEKTLTDAGFECKSEGRLI